MLNLLTEQAKKQGNPLQNPSFLFAFGNPGRGKRRQNNGSEESPGFASARLPTPPDRDLLRNP
jgi:hypothetical protein